MKQPRNKASANTKSLSGSTRVARSMSAPAIVLHIDDDPNDTELFQAAARRAGVRFAIQNVADGEQAMAYLNGLGVYANRDKYPLPVLVLLDLKMPRTTGLDMLRWIRKHPEVGNLRVMILSGSELRDDIQQAYAGGADSYLVKPIGFKALMDVVKSIDDACVGGPASGSGILPLCEARHPLQGSIDWFNGPGTAGARP